MILLFWTAIWTCTSNLYFKKKYYCVLSQFFLYGDDKVILAFWTAGQLHMCTCITYCIEKKQKKTKLYNEVKLFVWCYKSDFAILDSWTAVWTCTYQTCILTKYINKYCLYAFTTFCMVLQKWFCHFGKLDSCMNMYISNLYLTKYI